MISWVRERVATRWIQTRKRGGDATATGQTTEDDEDEDEDTRSFNNKNSEASSIRGNDDESFANDQEEEEEEEDREDEQEQASVHPQLLNLSQSACPPSPSHRQQQHQQHQRPQDTNNSKSPTNRSIRVEKHNSKLEIRTKTSVAPSSSLGIVVPGPSSSSRGSPVIARAAVLDQRAPSSPVSHSPRPSFGFLSRRFFSGSRNRTTLSTPPVPPTPPPPPVVLYSHNHHNNHTGASNNRRQQRQYQLNGGGGQRDSGNGQQSSTSSCSPSATVTSVFSPPKAVSTTNTGTISKLSPATAASANCTRGFKSSITLRVICIRGGSIDVTFPITKTGRELKMEAIGRFSVDWGNSMSHSTSPASAQSALAKYKLVTMNRRNVIDEELTLDRNGLRDRDQLLLVVKRSSEEGDWDTSIADAAAAADSSTGSMDKRKAALEEELLLRGPSMKEIQRATEHLPPPQQPPPKVNIDDMVLQTDLQYDIRKILISLAQSSAYVIGAGPFADRLILMLKQRLINKRKTETDSLNCLVDMGFAKHRAAYALQIREFVYADALRWLIENPRQEVPSLEEMETRHLFEQIRPLGDVSVAEAAENEDGEEEGSEKEGAEMRVLDAGLNSFNSRREYIETLLEIIRLHSQRDMPVCDEMVAKLMEMGFVEEEVREALKITQNNQAAACEWLIGSRSKSLTELRDGLPADSPILKALLASPQVQISLGNPKMLLAYLSMLENYSSMNMWLSDTDTSGVLGHILRTYHEEKHIVAINQFSIVL